MSKRRERIERFKSNAEFQRKQGDLEGCLEFRELAEELEKLEQIEQIVDSRHSWFTIPELEQIREVLNG